MVQMAFCDLSHAYHKQVSNVSPACLCHPTVGNFDVSPYIVYNLLLNFHVFHLFSRVHVFQIAILDGWATNEQCLARQDQIQGHIVTPDQVVRVPQASDAIQAMRDERVRYFIC